MNKLLQILEENPKIGKIETYLKPSLDDELHYRRITIYVSRNRDTSLFSEFVNINPSEDKDYFYVSFYTSIDPATSLLSDIYTFYCHKTWGFKKLTTSLLFVEFKIKHEYIHKIINYIYSCSN